MSLFGKKQNNPCGCDNAEQDSAVKILGGGCAKCNQLELNTKQALSQLGMSDAVSHVSDYADIASYGVMSTPALVYDGKVLCSGRVLKTDEIVELIQKEIQR